MGKGIAGLIIAIISGLFTVLIELIKDDVQKAEELKALKERLENVTKANDAKDAVNSDPDKRRGMLDVFKRRGSDNSDQ